LTKPVRHAHLAAYIATAMGLSQGLTALPQISHLQGHTGEAALGLKVLVVEDNAINQKVAAIILEKFGCRVDLAANGREALEASMHITYDCILMDCQMPEMDGFEATAAIRQREAYAGKRIPIFAMTANAMPSDRKRCLEAGMDGYLSKPMQAEALYATLLPYEMGRRAADAGALLTSAVDLLGSEVQERLHRLRHEHGPELVVELIDLFRVNTPQVVEQLREALVQQNVQSFQQAAHALKGSCRNLGLEGIAALCIALEQLGDAGALDDATALVDELETEFKQVELFLAAFTSLILPHRT
jgi:CheY-like chemotaxis protein